MAKITTGQSFNAGDQLTSTKLNNIVGSAFLDSDSITGTTLNLSNGQLKVATNGITDNELNTNSVTTAKIANDAVTYAKIQDVAASSVIGNTTGSTATPTNVAILDEDNMASNSATSLATQQSIKAYADSVGGTTNIVTNTANSGSSTADASTSLTLSAGTWLVRGDYTYHQSRVGGGTLAINGSTIHTSDTSPGDTNGTSQDVLFAVSSVILSSTTSVTVAGTASNGYNGTGLIVAMAWKTA